MARDSSNLCFNFLYSHCTCKNVSFFFNEEVGSQMDDGEFVEVKHVREIVRGTRANWAEWVEELCFATCVFGNSNQPGAEEDLLV